MKGIDIVAELMAVSATTAPKSMGENFVQVKIIKGKELKDLAKAMALFGEEFNKKGFDRGGKNVEASDAVVLIGLKDARPAGLNCGACGHRDCETLAAQELKEVEFKGPVCALRLLDMGIALGSAVKTASTLNVDNRIMYWVGAVARHVRLVDWDIVMGIPLSITGKNIFFDRRS